MKTLVLFLVLLAAPATAAVRGDHCPCMIAPFFEQFATGQREILACTDQRPFFQFVRLVADNFDLVVGWGGLGYYYCAWAPRDDGETLMPITAGQYRECYNLLTTAARRQGVPCLMENWGQPPCNQADPWRACH